MATSRSLIRRIDEYAIPLPVLLRIFLGAYFINSGYNKILDPVLFLKAVHLYDMLPETPGIYLNSTAIVLPWLEIVCGVALLAGLLTRGAAVLLAGMLCVFTPAIFTRALGVMAEEGIGFFQVKFDCGCGTGADTIWIKLSTNVGLLLVAVVCLISRTRRFSLVMLADRFRSSRRFCRRCGYPVDAGGSGICERCSPSQPAPVVSSDATA